MSPPPSPQRRYPAPQHVRRVRPKTYSVAVYIVVAIVLLQVAMLISVFWLRAMVVTVGVNLPKPQGGPGAATYQPIAPSLNSGVTPKNPDMTVLPALELSTKHLARLKVPSPSDELAQVSTLNEEAEVFLRQNDYSSAVDLLIRAEDVDPRYPTTLKNLAETYNAVNDPVKARQYWQRLVDLGPGVGTIYGVAKDHVLLLESEQNASPLKDPSTLDRVVYVDSVEKTPASTTNGDAQFHVRAVLARKDPQMVGFDQKKLQPYVIFYQQMPDGSLVPDLCQRKGSFDDTFLFWGDKLKEPFGVDYVMPIPGTPGPNDTTQGKYYGFVIGIYYDKVLQDVRSEPTDLSSRMALPREIE